MTINMTIIMNI